MRQIRTACITVLLGAVTLQLGCAAAQTRPHATWSNAAPMPDARHELYPEVLDGRIYVAGGILNPNTRYADRMDAYDPASDRWISLAPLPQPRHHITLSAVGGRLYGIGGFSGGFPNWQARSDMWVYDPARNSWTEGVDMPAPRAEGVAAVVDGRIYWIGGRVPATPGAAHFAGHRDSTLNEMFDPATRTWSRRAPAPTARNSAAAAVIDGKIYVVGGRRFDGMTDGVARQTNFSNLEVYDPAADTWETRAPMPKEQGGLGAAAIDGRLYACGGEQWTPLQGVIPDCWSYDPVRDAWTALPPMPTPRHGVGMAAVNGRLHVFGGATRPGGNSATGVHEVLSVPGEEVRISGSRTELLEP